MRKTDLTNRIARQTRVTQAEAADQLDRVIHEILVNLRKGESVRLPGLGEFRPGRDGPFRFEPAGKKPDAT
jgi:nucleoid DNA-binding protein